MCRRNNKYGQRLKSPWLSAAWCIALCALALSSPSCIFVELKVDEYPSGQRPAVGEKPDSVQNNVSLYVTGVEYPSGFDWRTAAGYDVQGCVLFLMKDGERVVEIPVSAENAVSADADMHRCIGGNLYTDYSTSSETIVKMNGAELFRFSGREVITDMLVCAGDVYTLGRSRNSPDGWRYRRNGELLLYKNSGELLSELHEYDGKVCFGYQEILDADRGVPRFYFVEDGVASLIPMPSDVVSIDSMRKAGGFLYCLARLSGMYFPILYKGQDACPLSNLFGRYMLKSKLFCCDGEVFVAAVIVSEDEEIACFWRETEFLTHTTRYLRCCGFCTDGHDIYYVGSRYVPQTGLKIYYGGEFESLENIQLEFIYGNCISACNGRCCVAVSDRQSGNRPALWIDGKVRNYDFNGVFTSVSYQ